MARRRITRREIKEDRFILFVYQVNDYITSHVQELLVGVGVVVAATLAGVWFANSSQASDEAASRLLAPAQTALQNNRPEDAIPIFERILNEYGGSTSARDATIGLANAYFRADNTAEAKRYYQLYIDDYGGGLLDSDPDIVVMGARAALASCREQEGEYLGAAAAYRKLAEDNNDNFLAPQLLIDAGRCYQAAEKTADAKTMYDTVVTKYEDSRYVNDARIALTTL